MVFPQSENTELIGIAELGAFREVIGIYVSSAFRPLEISRNSIIRSPQENRIPTVHTDIDMSIFDDLISEIPADHQDAVRWIVKVVGSCQIPRCLKRVGYGQ